MSFEIILRDDGTAMSRTIVECELGDISPVLMQYVERNPFCVPYVTQNWHFIRRPNERTTILFREVPVIRLKASFRVRFTEERMLVSPDYTMNPENEEQNRIEGMFEWRPHPTLQVLLAVEHMDNSDRETYLFFRHRTTHHIYRPPMGNVYEDGRLCLGEFYRESNGILETSQAILNWIMASRWNSDLTYYTQRQVQALFCWDANRVQIPVPNNWEQHCASFSTVCPNIVCEMLNTGAVE